MKYKLKTRLFAALALSGVSFYWPASGVFAQEDDFGFIQPAEPTRQNDQERNVPPIVSGASSSGILNPTASATVSQPQIVVPPVVRAPNARAAASSAPIPFAASNVFNGAYVQSGAANVGYAQHVAPSGTQVQAVTKQVAYDEPLSVPNQAPIGSGIQAQRDVPPIVETAQSTARRFGPQIIKPIEQNELPPILSSDQAASDSTAPPILTPKAGLDRLHPIPTNVADRGMIQDEFLLSADGETLNDASKVEPAAAFGASPLLVQDAPPIISGSVEPGLLPSSDGVLVPVDPAVDLPFGGSTEPFPRATPLDSTNSAPRSIVDTGTLIQSTTQPRPTYFEPTVQQPAAFGSSAVGSCSTCGTSSGSCGCSGSAVSGCSSCGGNGCFDPAAVEGMFNSSGSNAYARRYAILEGLYINRVDGTISNSNFGTLNNFDGSGGARITVGRRQDSTAGREFQYSGIDSIDETITVDSPAGLANAQFVPFGGLNTTNLQPFFNATNQEQSAETYFHSLEFNKVKWGWDVIKSYIGLRYLYVDDEYNLTSTNIANPFLGIAAQNGEFEVAAANHLIGPQIGGELYYDVGYRWSLSGVSRAGVYANFNEVDTRLISNGNRFIDSDDTSATVSFSYELGLTAKYRLTRQAQFRLGYNLYFWDNLATAADNLENLGGGIGISPTFGTSSDDSDSMFLQGVSFGFEVYR